jgi:putative NADH-flavin reductase
LNIVVFGASGRTGLKVVEQALEAGHRVTAYVRNAPKLTGQVVPSERLRIVEGDATDSDKVLNAVKNQEAIIVALGPGPNAPAETTTQGLQQILIAAKTHTVRRVVVVSGAGIHVSSDKKKPFDKIVSVLVRAFNGADVAEKEKQYQMLAQSGLD